MKIEYGDFQIKLGCWSGLGLLFAFGILADLIAVVLTGYPIY